MHDIIIGGVVVDDEKENQEKDVRRGTWEVQRDHEG